MKIGPVDPEIALLNLKKKKEINASKIYSPVGRFAERAKLVLINPSSSYFAQGTQQISNYTVAVSHVFIVSNSSQLFSHSGVISPCPLLRSYKWLLHLGKTNLQSSFCFLDSSQIGIQEVAY